MLKNHNEVTFKGSSLKIVWKEALQNSEQLAKRRFHSKFELDLSVKERRRERKIENGSARRESWDWEKRQSGGTGGGIPPNLYI